jgi:lipoprotein-anchoring transpeptidase ErfK/SrfK
MKRRVVHALLLLGLLSAFVIPLTALAAGPQWVVVNWGDTLYGIAARYGTSVGAMLQANHLPDANFVYAGQRLVIPNGVAPGAAPSGPAPNNGASAANSAYYSVHAGDTLYSIASRYGVSVAAIASANRIWNYDFIYSGQQLRIPGGNPAPAANQPPTNPTPASPPAGSVPPILNTSPSPNAADTGKWIDVNISTQTITAYEGSNAVKTVLVSTGIASHPTVVGRYAIYVKYTATTMTGGTPGVDYYYLPNVPWTMYFYRGYGIHGTYWHHNFGHPMSHGCVNLTIPDAKWFYDWAPLGTTVVTHY